MTMAETGKQTISNLHELFVKKTISPPELLQETLKKAKDAEPKINAFREFTLDDAFESARLAENKFLTGHINSQVLAPAMGHSVETHERCYSNWIGENYFDDIFEKATQG